MCTSPNYMIWQGKTYLETKKKRIPYEDDPNPILPSDYYEEWKFGDIRPKLEFIGKQSYWNMVDSNVPWIAVPCGQCLECRIQQSRAWADRVILEAKKYQHNYFVTLTYDDNHLPYNNSLSKDDFQKFIKKLRNLLKRRYNFTGLRFFGCGEYGDTTRRCHLHLILFNCPLQDLGYDFLEAIEHEYNDDGSLKSVKFRNHHMPMRQDMLMYSALIHEAWNYKGNISVGKVTYDSANYVAGYVVKKHKPGMAKYYHDLGIEPEFVLMSNHPGIASDTFNKDPDIHYQDKLIIPGRTGAHLSNIPRYYDKLFIKKYGEDVFNQCIRYDRIKSRFNTISKNIHFGQDNDYHSWNRNYKQVKKQRLRNSI